MKLYGPLDLSSEDAECLFESYKLLNDYYLGINFYRAQFLKN